MDDTRTRDARAGRPRRDLPESLAWLYDQDGDEQELSREPRPYVPGAAVPPGPVTSGGQPADPEALPTLLPFSAPEAELSGADEDPEPFPAVIPPDALLAPPARVAPFVDPPARGTPGRNHSRWSPPHCAGCSTPRGSPRPSGRFPRRTGRRSPPSSRSSAPRIPRTPASRRASPSPNRPARRLLLRRPGAACTRPRRTRRSGWRLPTVRSSPSSVRWTPHPT